MLPAAKNLVMFGRITDRIRLKRFLVIFLCLPAGFPIMTRQSCLFLAAWVLLGILCLGSGGGARAGELGSAGGGAAAQAGVEQPLRLSLDKSEILRFDREIGSIILGNSVPASVLMDTPQTVVVVPKAIGATHATILAKDGRVLMDRHIIVDSSGGGYVRIRTTCIGKEKGCTPNRSFYCPNGRCAEIMVAEPKESKDSTMADPSKAELDAVNEQAAKDAQTGSGAESPPN